MAYTINYKNYPPVIKYMGREYIGGGENPTLINKSISANGTYNASSDNADGYSSVTVEIEGGEITPVFSGLSYGYLGSDGDFYSSKSAVNKIDVFDSLIIQKHAAGIQTLSEEQLALADVNGDGNVDILDAMEIQKFASGKITEFKK